MRQFMLPDLGEGLEEAEIVTWHVNEGDHVVTDQPLVSVETDKAVVEVPSPYSGRIVRVFGAGRGREDTRRADAWTSASSAPSGTRPRTQA